LNPQQLDVASQRCFEKEDRFDEIFYRRIFRNLVVECFR